jgi:hypothetical protein
LGKCRPLVEGRKPGTRTLVMQASIDCRCRHR